MLATGSQVFRPPLPGLADCAFNSIRWPARNAVAPDPGHGWRARGDDVGRRDRQRQLMPKRRADTSANSYPPLGIAHITLQAKPER
ncbi:hypothetical protein ACHMW6_21735 [Pseudoduganella sp. UC29_106]|uniref:hypothetical protein n=1 Tax=Pseudoduganella sp. UC29_106 TaxID=3374553 RepID=UPI0037577A3B